MRSPFRSTGYPGLLLTVLVVLSALAALVVVGGAGAQMRAATASQLHQQARLRAHEVVSAAYAENVTADDLQGRGWSQVHDGVLSPCTTEVDVCVQLTGFSPAPAGTLLKLQVRGTCPADSPCGSLVEVTGWLPAGGAPRLGDFSS